MKFFATFLTVFFLAASVNCQATSDATATVETVEANVAGLAAELKNQIAQLETDSEANKSDLESKLASLLMQAEGISTDASLPCINEQEVIARQIIEDSSKCFTGQDTTTLDSLNALSADADNTVAQIAEAKATITDANELATRVSALQTELNEKFEAARPTIQALVSSRDDCVDDTNNQLFNVSATLVACVE